MEGGKFKSRQFEEAAFSVLYAMIKDNEPPGILAYIALFIEDIQLLSFSWLLDFGFTPLPERFSFEYSGPEGDYSAWRTQFWVFFAIVAVAVLNALYIAYAYHRGRFKAVWPVRLLRILSILMSTILLMPIVSTFFQALKCAKEHDETAYMLHGFEHVECFSGPHLPIFILAILALCVMLTYAVVISLICFEPDPRAHAPNSKPHGRTDTAYVIVRVFLTGVYEFCGHGRHAMFAKLIIALIMIIGLCWMVLTFQPFYAPTMTDTRAGFFFAGAGCVVIALGTYGAEGNGTAAFAVLVAMTPLFFGLGFVCSGLARRHLTRGVYRRLAVAPPVRLASRQMLEFNNRDMASYAVTGDLPEAKGRWTLSGIEKITARVSKETPRVFRRVTDVEIAARFLRTNREPEAILLAHDLFAVALQEFPHSPLLRIIHARYIAGYSGQDAAARKQLEAAMAMRPGFDIRCLLFMEWRTLQQEKHTEAELGIDDELSITSYIQFQMAQAGARGHHIEAIRLACRFWRTACSSASDPEMLFFSLAELSASRTKAQFHYESLLSDYPKSKANLRLYAHFLTYCCNNPDKAEEYTMAADAIEDDEMSRAVARSRLAQQRMEMENGEGIAVSDDEESGDGEGGASGGNEREDADSTEVIRSRTSSDGRRHRHDGTASSTSSVRRRRQREAVRNAPLLAQIAALEHVGGEHAGMGGWGEVPDSPVDDNPVDGMGVGNGDGASRGSAAFEVSVQDVDDVAPLANPLIAPPVRETREESRFGWNRQRQRSNSGIEMRRLGAASAGDDAEEGEEEETANGLLPVRAAFEPVAEAAAAAAVVAPRRAGVRMDLEQNVMYDPVKHKQSATNDYDSDAGGEGGGGGGKARSTASFSSSSAKSASTQRMRKQRIEARLKKPAVRERVKGTLLWLGMLGIIIAAYVVSLDAFSEQRTRLDGLKTGTRPRRILSGFFLNTREMLRNAANGNKAGYDKAAASIATDIDRWESLGMQEFMIQSNSHKPRVRVVTQVVANEPKESQMLTALDSIVMLLKSLRLVASTPFSVANSTSLLRRPEWRFAIDNGLNINEASDAEMLDNEDNFDRTSAQTDTINYILMGIFLGVDLLIVVVVFYPLMKGVKDRRSRMAAVLRLIPRDQIQEMVQILEEELQTLAVMVPDDAARVGLVAVDASESADSMVARQEHSAMYGEPGSSALNPGAAGESVERGQIRRAKIRLCLKLAVCVIVVAAFAIGMFVVTFNQSNESNRMARLLNMSNARRYRAEGIVALANELVANDSTTWLPLQARTVMTDWIRTLEQLHDDCLKGKSNTPSTFDVPELYNELTAGGVCHVYAGCDNRAYNPAIGITRDLVLLPLNRLITHFIDTAKTYVAGDGPYAFSDPGRQVLAFLSPDIKDGLNTTDVLILSSVSTSIDNSNRVMTVMFALTLAALVLLLLWGIVATTRRFEIEMMQAVRLLFDVPVPVLLSVAQLRRFIESGGTLEKKY